MSSDFWNGEFVAALFDVHDKQTGFVTYPSTTLFNADSTNGSAEPEAISQINVDGSVKIAVGVTVV